ncbi:AzlC family ABC transporter permease [Helicobacter sp. T3_23-1059]
MALKEAFPHTLPIFVGYLLMGATFGILLQKAGFSWVFAFGMGVIIYAGAMQFACVVLLANGASLAESFLLSLMINSRQIFYALSALSLFGGVEKKKKYYLIFSLTDETFALLNLKKPRPKKSNINSTQYRGYFMFFIALLNQIYWVLGCVFGALLSQNLASFNAQGMAFVMNAIFIVLFIEQWRVVVDKTPALIGIFVSLVCLLIFGKEFFLLPSLVAICGLLFYLQSRKNPYKNSPAKPHTKSHS